MSGSRKRVADAWRAAARSWAPPPSEPLSDWLEREFVPQHGGTPGGFRLMPFQRGIADAMGDLEIPEVTVLKSARVGFTALAVGYAANRIETDPCRMLCIQATGEDAEGFSKEDLAPALEATPAVSHLVAEAKSRDSRNTLDRKTFPGGWLRVGGAHSPRPFRRLTADVVIFDEVDAYPKSAGSEGDQVELGKKRAHTSAFPKFILGSSPKLLATSRIIPSWKESDQRDYMVPCPECDHGQRLEWGGKGYDYGIKWQSGRPEDAFYLCKHCACEIPYGKQFTMVSAGRWEVGKPEVVGHAGFRIWAAYSSFPAAAWGLIAEEFLRVRHDPFRFQVFTNTVLGQPYVGESGDNLDENVLMARARAETWSGALPVSVQVPKEVAVLTLGADVNADNVAYEVIGWGREEESWSIEYGTIRGDIREDDDVLLELDRVLAKPWMHEKGFPLYIRGAALDSGYASQLVLEFTRDRMARWLPNGQSQFLFAIKGKAGFDRPVWPLEASISKKVLRAKFYTLGVDPAKQIVYGRLARRAPGPGFCHFPRDRGAGYFEGLTAEHLVPHATRSGVHMAWEVKTAGQRVEPLDCRVYGYAVLVGLHGEPFLLDLAAECDRVEGTPERPLGEILPQGVARMRSGPDATPQRRRRGRGFEA